MFRIRHSASLAAIVLGAATLAFANDGTKLQLANQPVVTHVGYGMARDPGHIQIQGKNLGLIQEVRLDGVVVPVVRNNSYSLWLDLLPQEPGFGQLELFYPRGVLTESVSFTPTLVADHRPAGTLLTMDSGDSGGFYSLSYSIRMRSEPLSHLGIYYMNMIDTGIYNSGVVGADFFESRFATEVFQHGRLSLIGRPVHFQALCTADNGDMCYSNVASIYLGHFGPSDGPTAKM
jgi:hypothetical protein